MTQTQTTGTPKGAAAPKGSPAAGAPPAAAPATVGADAKRLEVDALLKEASAAPVGKKLEDFNPLENIPTLSVGDEIQPGMTISGYFVETQRISSHKFTHAQEKDENGVPVQRLHVFRLESGKLMGIWNCGELKLICSRLAPNEFISMTYTGKGKNDKGQQQHFFSCKKAAGLN